ncbi:MurR/RpiR family transcriptional regulator [Paenibacillus albiflavus]|uniref:MurR/RpiR family transcriptional regulator n=1 Tax=Paenibacillus albiflavus TaxID=2545760 RepID=A0A4R4EGK3_9BACL|nr:MurR/RpiR family transcriptional regulator [Paenibacillus albiflavus]TCZ78737.1 MurR/RpiR family transcriptional regulator [Paenibacillus albiflavus]
MDLRAQINSLYPSLTKSEQKVARQVLDHTDEVIYYSVTELAEYSQVGETTVIRFCRKIGFKGYQEFKLALAQNQTYKKLETNIQEGNPADFTQDIFNGVIQVLQVSLSLLNKQKLQEAIDLIDNARHVQFFGVGSSGITALDAKNRFLRIGRRSEATADSHIQAMSAVLLEEGDVAIGFSVSGSTLDTNDILAKAKKNGAKVIAITNYAKSPITSIADIVLLTAGKESPLEGGSITAKISQLFVLDLICEGLSLKDSNQSKIMKERTARAVIDRSY